MPRLQLAHGLVYVLLTAGVTSALVGAAQMPPSEEKNSTTAPGLDSLWSSLGAADAEEAYRAIWALVQAPARTVSYVAEHLIAFTRDGQFLASGSKDGTVRLWSMKQFQEVSRFAPVRK